MKRRLFFCLLSFFCYLAGLGQPPSFLFKTLTTRNGLSYNLVNYLFQDSEGYIWVGTFNGLNRYDGSRFVVFKHDRNNPRSIAHSNIMGICEDKAGDLWIGTPNGVSRYNKVNNVFTNYLLEPASDDASRNNDVTNILCDREGVIWVSSYGGLYEFIPGSNSFKAYKHDDSNVVTISSNRVHRNAMVADPRQSLLWIGTNKGINCFDTHTKVFYHYRHNPEKLPVFTGNDAFAVAFDQQYRLVYGDYGLFKLVYYSVADRSIQYLDEVVRINPKHQPATVASIFFDKDNNGWFSAWNYTIQYKDGHRNSWYPLVYDEADPTGTGSYFFWHGLQAKDGSIYIGGMQGLSVYNPAANFYSVYKPVEQITALRQRPGFTSMVEDKTGRLWLGNDGLGLVCYDFTTGQYKHLRIPASANLEQYVNRVNHLSCIGDELWLCTEGGVYIFNPATQQFRPFRGIGSNVPVSWSFMDRQRQIWFSVGGRHLYRYDPVSGQHTQYNPDSVFVDVTKGTDVSSVVEDNAGNIWFGAFSGRLYRYSLSSNQFSSFIPDRKQSPGVLQRPINGLHADGQGKVWMATEGGGLIRFDPASGAFRSWMETDGLIMDVCNGLMTDKQGKLWVGSYEGYTIFDPQQERIVNPRVDYGQRENNFLSGGRCMLQNGKLAFTNMGNIIVIDPMQVGARRNDLFPVISGITVFEKSTPLYHNLSAIHLSWKENFFTIDFSALTPHHKETIEYGYRLVNYDKDWVISSRNFAAYTGVSGGDYQFEVKARYKGGEWSEAARLAIYIQPPFWQTWWFRIVVGLLVIASIIAVVKLRERRLVKEQRVKGEFRERLTSSEMKALRSQMNPHFLYNSLNAIRLFVLQNDSDNAEKYLVKFARLMRLILDNSRQDWINLRSEVEQLQLYLELEQLRFDNKFDFTIQVDPSLHKENTSVPPMIIQPYIENSILHGIAHKADKGMISVTIRPSNGHLECIVEDDGVGRTRAQELKSKRLATHKSVGLQVTQERLQLISERTGKSAGVEVVDLYNSSHEATGTKVVICLPLVSQ